MDADLSDCRMKIDHAKRKVDTLDDSVRRFLDDKPYTLALEPDGEKRRLRVRTHREPPREWALDVGEIAYQLRSALDHLVYQLVIRNGQDPDAPGRMTQFPIYWNSEHYMTERQRRDRRKLSDRDFLMDGVSRADKRVIDEYQPFQRGPKGAPNDPLERLRQLSDRDKHRHPFPAFAILEEFLAHFRERNPPHREVTVRLIGGATDGPRHIDDTNELFSVSANQPDTDVQVQGQLGIGFGQGLVSVETIRLIADRCDEIVDRFERRI